VLIAVRRTRARDERGQALVEFALIAPLFLMIVFGIIQFGVGLNYWLDLQRIANQGARWAAVNAYPNCPVEGPAAPCSPTLQEYLVSEPVSGGLKPTVSVCFEQMSEPTGAVIGDPVTVHLNSDFKLLPLIGIGRVNLKAEATMRIERQPTRYLAGSC
jgi:TadE-like protein